MAGTSTAKVRRWSSFEVRLSLRWGRERVSIENESVIASPSPAKEVTVEQFQRFLKENPHIEVKNYEPYSPEPTCPMNSVSWCDAAAYCNWLSKQEGLPEDQWCYGPNEKGDYAEGMKLMSESRTERVTACRPKRNGNTRAVQEQ